MLDFTILENTKVKSLILMLILLVGFFLRFYHLDYASISGDEGISIYFAGRDLKALLSSLRDDSGNSFYYSLLYLWIKLFGNSASSVRSLSLLFGLLTIALIYKVGSLLFNQKVGLLSSLILSLSAFHTWYSQDTRMHVMATFLCLASYYFFINLIKYDRKIDWISYLIVTIASFYCQGYTFLILLSQNLYVITKFRKVKFSWKKWGGAHFLFIIFLIPWFKLHLSVLSSIIRGPEGFVTNISVLELIPTVFAKYSLFGNRDFLQNNLMVYGLAAVVFSLCFLLGIVSALRKNKREEAWLLLLYLFVPIVSVMALSSVMSTLGLSGRFLYRLHAFILFLPPYIIILANGIEGRSLKVGLPLLASLIVFNIFTLRNFNYGDEYTKPKIRQVIEYLQKVSHPGDIIGIIPPRLLEKKPSEDRWVPFFPYEYYNQGTLRIFGLYGKDPKGLIENIKKISGSQGRIWLIFYEDRHATDINNIILKWMKQNYTFIAYTKFYNKIRDNGLCLYSFRHKIE